MSAAAEDPILKLAFCMLYLQKQFGGQRRRMGGGSADQRMGPGVTSTVMIGQTPMKSDAKEDE